MATHGEWTRKVLSATRSVHSFKTTVLLLAFGAFGLSEKVIFDSEQLRKVREGKAPHDSDNITATTRRSNFIWRISVTKTTVFTTEKVTVEPYQRMVDIMVETFREEKNRELVKKEAKENYANFLNNLRFKGPDGFIESLADNEFILYSDLLEKKRLWKENWLTILSFLEMAGEEGFQQMLSEIERTVKETQKDTVSTTSEVHFTVPIELINNAADKLSSLSPNETIIEDVRRQTVSQGVISMPSTMPPTQWSNQTSGSEESEDYPLLTTYFHEEVATTATTTLSSKEMGANINDELEKYYNSSYTHDRNIFRKQLQDLDDEMMANIEDRIYVATPGSQEVTRKGEYVADTEDQTPVRRTLTHNFSRFINSFSTLVSKKSTTIGLNKSTTLNFKRMTHEADAFSYGTKLTGMYDHLINMSLRYTMPAVPYVYKLMGRSPTPERKRGRKRKRKDDEEEQSTMAEYPSYEVDETWARFTYEDWTITYPMNRTKRYKYTLPMTTPTAIQHATKQAKKKKIARNNTMIIQKLSKSNPEITI